jgi:hypothetical protein
MMGLRGRTKALPALQLTAVGAGAACLSGWAALALTGLSAGAISSCPDPGAVSGLVKSINTSLGCDIAAGNAGYPVTGYIAFRGAASTTYLLIDVYQTLPNSTAQLYFGNYTLNLTSVTGTSSNGS